MLLLSPIVSKIIFKYFVFRYKGAVLSKCFILAKHYWTFIEALMHDKSIEMNFEHIVPFIIV